MAERIRYIDGIIKSANRSWLCVVEVTVALTDVVVVGVVKSC